MDLEHKAVSLRNGEERWVSARGFPDAYHLAGYFYKFTQTKAVHFYKAPFIINKYILKEEHTRWDIY